uniref:Gelsolin-like domain-containing protein n=1 Tax=Helicotheca tamesis TaxID=374047 RepID=A0A7S2MMJ7_9STRA|mmetsp:Transcript_18442/g.25383  ORF Transcript_18442/g.25383 Transcript_18442/m.25383 type:complete len:420 (+) Transcript_18442:102-1361(+)|eukprot:CAMPEP_0185729520 /NCGR_PEP_ID=MMETSP1171-20130828/6296_1 /TAXON_ID=374046 /ORGANISM="Helicotheca tamensis, Strain CCMP826" /LENGTH=419 /DNA_ID=CAMNT_0028398385 /DNA_START=79 /DNA_END=1338 /DNA_ORIENTATION=+
MQKPEKVSWKDTNLALIGSELDKKIKKAAAEGEPQWTDVGDNVQLKVWRIEKFVVKPWPEHKYGQFHTGDSYIICNSYQPDPNNPKISHDIHIWIGDESSQDEYGTAAYKMVELDDKLGGTAVQHREIQGEESEKFIDYFDNKVTYLAGGIESGFKHVEAGPAEPHLYHVKGTRKGMILKQVPVRRDSMNGGDVFILVAGDEKVWLWCGAESNKDEKCRGLEVARAYCKKGNVVTLDQGENDGEMEAKDFWEYMPVHVSSIGVFTKSLHVQEADNKDSQVQRFTPVLFQLPNKPTKKMKKVATAKMVVSGCIKEPKFKRTELKSKNGYLVDTGFHIYIWLGKDAKTNVKKDAVLNSSLYAKQNKRPLLPLMIVKAGYETTGFNNFFYDPKGSKGSGSSDRGLDFGPEPTSPAKCACAIM